MNSVLLKKKRDSLRVEIENLISTYNQLPNGNCFECKHLSHGKKNICLKYQAEPPQEFLECPDCDEWIYDGLPTVLNDATWEEFDKEVLPF